VNGRSAVRVEGLGKQYRVGRRRERPETFAAAAWQALATPVRNYRTLERLTAFDDDADSIWALRDVSFSLDEGEALGIIGRNGAGKSTLLKILSRTVEPSAGEAELWGRTASLLEVGTGFHNDLTGRENVYLNGAILGLRKREIADRFDEIVEFADLAAFIDTPVKRYSSGMYLRLAFAVAAHLDADILLADEVLAVGDAQFQRKCLRKMRDAASGGRTVIFVSHNMAAVSALCTRALWLESGRARADGPVDEVVRTYLGSVASGEGSSVRDRPDHEGDGRLRITDVEFRSAAGEPRTSFSSGEDVCVVLLYESRTDERLGSAHASISIETTLGERVGLVSSGYAGDDFEGLPARGRISCTLPRLPLNTGEYVCSVWVTVSGRKADSLRDAAVFAVEATNYYGTGRQPSPGWGSLLLDNEWAVEPQ